MKGYQKVAVHGLIKRGNRFLITRRSEINDWKPGEWDIPGGTVEFGETDCRKALAREIGEETGLVVETENVIHLYSSMSNKERHQFQIIYKCKFLGGEIRLNPEEHDDYKWVTTGELKKYKMIAFLRDWYKKKSD